VSEIRFHLDENVHPGVAVGLRGQGIEVTTANDLGLSGANDDDQLAAAHDDGRTLVTHDDDFTRIHSTGVAHSGICYCHQHKYSVGELNQSLLLVHGCMTADEMAGHIEYL
jgi:hypothetical protein